MEGRGILMEEETKQISSFRGIVEESMRRFVYAQFECGESDVRWLSLQRWKLLR